MPLFRQKVPELRGNHLEAHVGGVVHELEHRLLHIPHLVFRNQLRLFSKPVVLQRLFVGANPFWSRDGNHLVYNVTGQTGSRKLWYIPMTGDGEPKPLPESAF
ncbi:MAG TPA: hypothetical protein EYQ20_16595 [candidate division Zixibacteria bacterium]|nr:hypothetical protein [candidate division Zixibacteria bacterium]